MGKASRDKGKRGEREARDQIRKLWNAPDCIRAAQSCGAWSADVLAALPDSHVEVKRYAKIAACRFLEQAIADAKDDLPILLMREDKGEWMVLLRMSDTPRFATSLSRQLNHDNDTSTKKPDQTPD